MKRLLAFVQIALIAFAGLMASSFCTAQDNNGPDFSRVTQVPRQAVDTWLKAQVKQSGGDWDTGRYSFYVGFSTGGFGTDTVSAIAMSRLAFGIMNNSLAVGDRITSIAWELTDEKVGQTSTLSDDTDTRKAFVDSVPYAPRSDTRGGHDVEQTLYDTVTQHLNSDEKSSSIILLLTTDDHSEAATKGDTHLFGADNSLLTNALKSGGFRNPTHEAFTLGSKDGNRTIYIIGLFPKKLVSLPGSFGQRYPTFPVDTWQPSADKPSDSLPNDVKPPSTSPPPPHTAPPVTQTVETRGGIQWQVWLLLALLVVGVILFMVMGKRSGVQRPLQPVAATVAAPKVETIPGSLRVTIGPDEQTISPLVKGSTWTVSRQPDGTVKLVDTSKPAAAAASTANSTPGVPAKDAPVTNTNTAPSPVPDPVPVPGTSLAKLSFGDDRALHADADSGAQFAEMQGTAADKCDSRTLLIEPGKRVVCRVLPPDAASKTRLEIVYDTQAGKGSRV